MVAVDLHADCSRCFGLCCVALPFGRSADFAVDKAAGEPCPNLGPDFRCGIHSRLRQEGFRGCTVFDCFGAGQHVSQETFAGRNWREEPEVAGQMFAVFATMRGLHELLWYLAEALTFPEAAPLKRDLGRARAEVEDLTRSGPEVLATLDVAPLREKVGALLARASALVRKAVPGPSKDHRGADLVGARLSRADLRGAELRGAYLIAADLTGADLRTADLLGADLRDAELAGADLTGCLFLTQAQLDAAKGDTITRLPPTRRRPGHWTSAVRSG